MESEQHLSVLGEPQNTSESEEGVGSAARKARRKRQPAWRRKLSREGYSQEEIDSMYKQAMEKYEADNPQPEKSKTPPDNLHIQLNPTLTYQASTDPCVFGGWGRTYELIIAKRPERIMPQRRQGRRDHLPSPKKLSTAK